MWRVSRTVVLGALRSGPVESKLWHVDRRDCSVGTDRWQLGRRDARVAARHELHIFALRQYPQSCSYPLLGATVHNLGELRAPPGGLAARRVLALLAGLKAQGPFDILHGFWADGPGLLAALAGRCLRIPAILTLAGGELVTLPEIGYGVQRHWAGRVRVRLACQLSDQVTAATRYMINLAAQKGISAVEIPLGVHPDWFGSEPGLPEQGPPWRLLHVASLNRVKDQHTLLMAFRQVLAVAPETHLDIIGEDTLGGEIQNLCAELGLTEAVSFHGFLPNAETRHFYRQAHLLVLPSRHDAAAMVMLEAAACGVSTVASQAVGHAVDWAPEAARTVPVGDASALAQAILDLLHAPQERIALGSAARNWAHAHDSRWTARQFEELYLAQLTR